MKVALDTTNLLGRGAVKDTCNLLADGIVKLLRALAAVEQARSMGPGRDMREYLGSSVKGEAAIDWSDKRARRPCWLGLWPTPTGSWDYRGRRRGNCPRTALSGSGLWPRRNCWGSCCSRTWSALMTEWVSLKDGVSRDRMMSVHDPELRHGRKSSSRRFDGHKAAIVVDTDSQLITAVAVLPGNAPDNLGALELVEQSEANTGVPVAEAMGDAAYGDGDTRQAFADAGRTLIARVPGRPNRSHFPKEDFRIDLESGSCTCPAGQVARRMAPAGRRTGQTGRTYRLEAFRFDAAVCGVCPLRSQCLAAKPGTGRTVQLHPQEALLQQARALQQSEAFAEYRQRRVVVEHRWRGWSNWESASPATSAVHQNPVPVVLGRHGVQPDPGGGQSRVDRRNRLRSQRRQRPGRWHRQPRRQCRHRLARAILDPHSARIGLTDQILLPDKGFPSGFLGAAIASEPFVGSLEERLQPPRPGICWGLTISDRTS